MMRPAAGWIDAMDLSSFAPVLTLQTFTMNPREPLWRREDRLFSSMGLPKTPSFCLNLKSWETKFYVFNNSFINVVCTDNDINLCTDIKNNFGTSGAVSSSFMLKMLTTAFQLLIQYPFLVDINK